MELTEVANCALACCTNFTILSAISFIIFLSQFVIYAMFFTVSPVTSCPIVLVSDAYDKENINSSLPPLKLSQSHLMNCTLHSFYPYTVLFWLSMSKINDSFSQLTNFSCTFYHLLIVMIKHGNCGIKHIHQSISYKYPFFTKINSD